MYYTAFQPIDKTYTVETLYSTIYYSKYFIELNFDKSTQYVALWTHKRHPIPRPKWSVFCEYFNRNWPCYKGFLLYSICLVFWSYVRISNWIHMIVSLCSQGHFTDIGAIIWLPQCQWSVPEIIWIITSPDSIEDDIAIKENKQTAPVPVKLTKIFLTRAKPSANSNSVKDCTLSSSLQEKGCIFAMLIINVLTLHVLISFLFMNTTTWFE